MFAMILSTPPKEIIHLVRVQNFSENYCFSVSAGKKCQRLNMLCARTKWLIPITTKI